jgi:hypothetical protein
MQNDQPAAKRRDRRKMSRSIFAAVARYLQQ